ncbi:hypothetical protein [Pseudomonas sp. NY11382]|uniref:hypothetical protein n=1 Tax=Pseudomonas sp. NY11382 TaxID=2939495 RepID=UPI0022DD3269|nr:hypothetical protein [Pseudomonas sp. NY11382]WBM30619.1 hypothetical protein M2J80_13595 [Pseudomonas sp. NY11382]
MELPPYLQEQLSFSKFEKPARFTCGGKPAKQATRCLAPALPVFAGTPAPTGGLRWLGVAAVPAEATVFLKNLKSLRDSPVGAGKPAKQATRCLAPAAPVFAGTPAPTGGLRWLGVAAVLAGATVFLKNLKSLRDSPVGAGKPAKQATRCLAPALPVFAGTPAPTGGLRWLGVAAVLAGATVFLKI